MLLFILMSTISYLVYRIFFRPNQDPMRFFHNANQEIIFILIPLILTAVLFLVTAKQFSNKELLFEYTLNKVPGTTSCIRLDKDSVTVIALKDKTEDLMKLDRYNFNGLEVSKSSVDKLTEFRIVPSNEVMTTLLYPFYIPLRSYKVEYTE